MRNLTRGCLALLLASVSASSLFGCGAPKEAASNAERTENTASAITSPTGTGPTWTALPPLQTNPPLPAGVGTFGEAMWLMLDGTVLAVLDDAQTLVKLTPDALGDYLNGQWSRAGSFLLAKEYFSSGVLSDGRLVACGGEYSAPAPGQPIDAITARETNYCEIYNPVTQISTAFAPPPGWGNIGDSPTAMLPDGTMLLGNTQGAANQTAVLNPATLTWTFGGGDKQSEQGYTLMQTGDVLTADTGPAASQRYSLLNEKFVPDAPVPVTLSNSSFEIGPSLSLMDGRVIAFGASGGTAIYTPTTAGQNGSWIRGPELPNEDTAPDVPAILEPNGNVLLYVQQPLGGHEFVEYLPSPTGGSFAIASGAPTGGNSARSLLLPNGHGLVTLNDGSWYDVGFDVPDAGTRWAPTITSSPASVSPGSTVTIGGTQLSGLSEVSAFGDDNQQAETYPTARLIPLDGASLTGGVIYLRAHDVSTRSIAPGHPGSVLVDFPGDLPAGRYVFSLIAMANPSDPVSLEVSCPPGQGNASGHCCPLGETWLDARCVHVPPNPPIPKCGKLPCP
jgi:hypothetical protein